MYFLPSEKVAVSLPPSAAGATTWLLVRMWPCLSKTKPVPVPLSELPVASMVTTLGRAFLAIAATEVEARLRSLELPEVVTVVELEALSLLRSAAQ